jgi:hypothetical protein
MLFEKADQVSLGLTLKGKGAVVTLKPAERDLVAWACRLAVAGEDGRVRLVAKPADASTSGAH